MKGPKGQFAPVPVLSQKRHSLQADRMAAAPYTLQWQNPGHSQAKSGSSKYFFQNMKNELTSIKNDFQKLIKKESSFNSHEKRVPRNDEPFSTGPSGAKGKSMTSVKKDAKRVLIDKLADTEKLELDFNLQAIEAKYRSKFGNKHKERAPQLHTDLTSEEYPSLARTQDQTQTKHIQVSSVSVLQAKEYKQLSLHCARLSQQLSEQHSLRSRCQQEITRFKAEAIALRNLNQKLVCEVSRYEENQSLLLSKSQQLSAELSSKLSHLSQQDQKIAYLSKELEQLQQTRGNTEQQVAQERSDLEKQKKEFQGKIKEFQEHRKQFEFKKCELQRQTVQQEHQTRDCLQLKESIQHQTVELQQKWSELERQGSQLEQQRRKIQHQSGQLQQYKAHLEGQSREIQQQSKEIQHQTKELQHQRKEIQQFNISFEQVRIQIQQGSKKLQHARRQIQSEKRLVQQERTQLQQERKQIQHDRRQLQQELRQIQQDRRQLSQQKGQLQQQRKQLQQRTMGFEGQKMELQSQIQKLQHQWKQLERQKGIFGDERVEIEQKGRGLPESRQLFERVQQQQSVIGELMFHNQNLHKINFELGSENEQLKAEINNMHGFIQHTQKVNEQQEIDLKRKMEFMRKEIQAYDQREGIFAQEIESLARQLHEAEQKQAPYGKEHSETASEGSTAEINMLREEAQYLRQQLQLQTAFNQKMNCKYGQVVKKLDFDQMQSSFEKTSQELAGENAILKSRVNSLEAEIDSVREQNRSFARQIQLYEQRERMGTSKPQLSSNEWEQMTEHIQHLTQQNIYLRESLEIRQLRNQTSKEQSFQLHHPDNLIELAQRQLEEIEQLRELVKDLRVEKDILRQEIEIQGTTCIKLKEVHRSSNNYGGQLVRELESLEASRRQVLALKQLILRVLVQKQGKCESQNEADYFADRLSSVRQLFL